MPPKAKITKEMIIDAAFEITRESGIERVNARTVSEKLGCSTQPVMYYFKKIEDIKSAVWKKTDDFHTEYIMNIQSNEPMMDIGMNFIRFAATEKNLFRLLFQSDGLVEKEVTDMVWTGSASPMLEVLMKTDNVDLDGARSIFSTIGFYVHGFASLLANNSMEYNEESARVMLKRVGIGARYAAKHSELVNQETNFSEDSFRKKDELL